MMVRAKDWFLVWLRFEISLIGFLPLFTISNLVVLEGLVKYFLVQGRGSALFLISVLEWNFSLSGLFDVFLPLSMCLKLGLFPFFYWVPAVMSTLSWFGCFVLRTVQKINPFIVLSNMIFNQVQFDLLLIFSGIGAFLSSLLGVNQKYLRSLMAFSSITHTR